MHRSVEARACGRGCARATAQFSEYVVFSDFLDRRHFEDGTFGRLCENDSCERQQKQDAHALKVYQRILSTCELFVKTCSRGLQPAFVEARHNASISPNPKKRGLKPA